MQNTEETETPMEMPKTPKELESFIKDYLKENMRINMSADYIADCIDVDAEIMVDGEIVSSDTATFRI